MIIWDNKSSELRLAAYRSFYDETMCYINFISAATTVPYEFCGEISSGRATIPETASRLLDLHHQYRPESSGSGLRGRWMQVHPIQLFSHRHEARLDVVASRKTDTLSRGIASERGHTLHHDFFRGSVIKFHRGVCKWLGFIKNVLLSYQEQRILQEEKDVKEKCNFTWTCSLLLTKNVNCYWWTE